MEVKIFEKSITREIKSKKLKKQKIFKNLRKLTLKKIEIKNEIKILKKLKLGAIKL